MIFNYPCHDTTEPEADALIRATAAQSPYPAWFDEGARRYLEDAPEPTWMRDRRLGRRPHVSGLAATLALTDAILDGPDPDQEQAFRDGWKWAIENQKDA